MKPFDLEKALSGDPVITREGYKVTQLKKYTLRYREAIVGVIYNGYENDNTVTTWNLNGNFYKNIQNDSRDLFMAEKPKKKYYLGILGMFTSPLYESKNELIEKNENQWEKIIEIELEE